MMIWNIISHSYFLWQLTDSSAGLIKSQRHNDDIVIPPVEFPGFLLPAFRLEIELFIEMDGSEVGGKNTEFDSLQASISRFCQRLMEESASNPLVPIFLQDPHAEPAGMCETFQFIGLNMTPSYNLCVIDGNQPDDTAFHVFHKGFACFFDGSRLGKPKVFAFTSNAINTGMKALYVRLGNLPDHCWIHSCLSQSRISRTDNC